MVDDTGATAQVRGESLGGGKMRISRINGVGVDISGMYSTLFVAHQDAPGVLAALTNLLAYVHVNIAFCRTYRTEVGGQAYSVFETDARPTTPSSLCCASSTMSITRPLSSSPVLPRPLSPGVSAKEIFDDGEQLLDACEERGLSIGAVMALREARLTGEAHAVAPCTACSTSCARRPRPPSSIRSARSAGLSAARQSLSMPPAATT